MYKITKHAFPSNCYQRVTCCKLTKGIIVSVDYNNVTFGKGATMEKTTLYLSGKLVAFLKL